MNKKDKPQFIAVVPNEKLVVRGYEEIDGYICKTIIATPGPSLLREIEAVCARETVSGILTRGSLARYLYENHIALPIFHLKYDLASILKMLQGCVSNGFQKIGLFEVSHGDFLKNREMLHTVLTVGGCQVYYYRFFESSRIEDTIRRAKDIIGLDVVAGDVEPIQVAGRLGIPCEHFFIGRESYYNAISEARYAADISMKETAQNDFIEAITNTMSEAVLIADEMGNVKRFNLQAQRLFSQQKVQHTVHEALNLDLTELLNKPENYLTEVGSRGYITNVLPMLIGEEQHYAIVLNSVKAVEELEHSIRTQYREKGLAAKSTFGSIICVDENTKQLVRTAEKYARNNSTVLIYGETGAGKEVFASSIHNASLRSRGPFVAINCATLNENLIESELFGYEKGSFTGALSSGKQGLFELAHKGSIFLDEIGELPLQVQAKLLRVLQEKEIMRVGGDKIIPIDVRVIAATNKNLKQMVSNGNFREDLYYRLALLEVHIPPLRERRGDIIPLFTTFLAHAAERESRSLYWEEQGAFASLLEYDWPGNVRELSNFAERVVLLCEGRMISAHFMREMMRKKCSGEGVGKFVGSITNSLGELEREYLAFLLQRFGGDREKLCIFLGISKTTLWRKLTQ